MLLLIALITTLIVGTFAGSRSVPATGMPVTNVHRLLNGVVALCILIAGALFITFSQM